MKVAVFKLTSAAELSQSRGYDREVPKLSKERSDDYEKRTWQNRCHITDKGNIFIPSMAFKYALTAAAKYLKEQIPGQGKATYTKYFESGILITDNVVTNFPSKDIKGKWFFVPSDGKRDGAKRVWKCFPVIPEWEGELRIMVLDETITADVLKRHLIAVGQFIGVGRFRPEKGGLNGRFKVTSSTWEDYNVEE